MLEAVNQLYTKILSLLKSEYCVDALRNTFAVVAPILVFYNLGKNDIAVGVGFGALVTCLTDLPGNRSDKKRAALINVLLYSGIALVTSYSITTPSLMVIWMVLLTFGLTMFATFGHRYGITGIMGIVLATLTIGSHPSEPFTFSLCVGAGVLWYSIISLIQIYLYPYRSLERVIAKTKRLTSDLLRLRAGGYNVNFSLKDYNQRNIHLHLCLTNQHDLIRQLLLTDRKVYVGDAKGRYLLQKSTDLIDLYEQVSAVHYDYSFIREQYKNSDVLRMVECLVTLLANSLHKNHDELAEYLVTRSELNNILKSLEGDKEELLQSILTNVDEIDRIVKQLNLGIGFESNYTEQRRYQDFIDRSGLNLEILKSHFTLRSAHFRFALRLAGLCFVTMVVITIIAKEYYSYWLFLTLLVVSSPNYNQTLTRNLERLIGTLLGLVASWICLQFLGGLSLLIAAITGLFVFFSFNRTIYAVSVLGITVAVMLCLNAYNGDLLRLFLDRMSFTIAGIALCFFAAFLFPIWNSSRVKSLLIELLEANLLYFENASKIIAGDSESIHNARLARKKSHQNLSLLSEAIAEAKKEPFQKNINWDVVTKVLYLNYHLSVLIATYAGSKKLDKANLKIQDEELILENLKIAVSNSSQLNIYEHDNISSWAGKPMNLLETSKTLANLVDGDKQNTSI